MNPSPSKIRKDLRYDPQTGLLWWRKRLGGRSVNRPAGSRDAYGYVRISYKGKQYKAHRIAWVIVKGRWPKKEMDHRNLIKHDNRWCNLRLATVSQNKRNRQVFKNTKSGIKGAVFHSKDGRWTSHIRVGGKQKYLGIFNTPKEAAMVYASAAKKYHGKFARIS